MVGSTLYEIEVNSTEQSVIQRLLEILEECPIDLSNDDYVDILREIANHSNDVSVSEIQIKYEDKWYE